MLPFKPLGLSGAASFVCVVLPRKGYEQSAAPFGRQKKFKNLKKRSLFLNECFFVCAPPQGARGLVG
jgi:hypothetical protein